MNEQQLREAVLGALTAVAPETDPASIDPGGDLFEQLDIDSMDFLNVIVSVHEQTGVEIPERDYPRLSTLDGAVAYLLAAQRPAAGGPPGGGRQPSGG